MFPASLSSPFSVYVHWRPQVSTSHLLGPGLASKLFVMSQIMLVAPPLKTSFSVSTENNDALDAKQPYSDELCTCIILHNINRVRGRKRHFDAAVGDGGVFNR